MECDGFWGKIFKFFQIFIGVLEIKKNTHSRGVLLLYEKEKHARRRRKRENNNTSSNTAAAG